jgi:hypothetical protein
MTAAALLLSLLAVSGRAEVSAGAGATATAGSSGYRSLSLFADAEREGAGVQPYGWGSLMASRDSRRFTAVGGGAADVDGGVRLNAGAGFSVGRLVDTGGGAGALVLEAGAEKKLDAVTAGAGWTLSAGRLAAPAYAPAEDRRRRRSAEGKAAGRGRRPQDETLPSESYNELSAFARLPLAKARLTLRAALGLPSYGDNVVSETASIRFPLTEPLSVSAGITLEQADRSRAYVSAGFYYLFD